MIDVGPASMLVIAFDQQDGVNLEQPRHRADVTQDARVLQQDVEIFGCCGWSHQNVTL